MGLIPVHYVNVVRIVVMRDVLAAVRRRNLTDSCVNLTPPKITYLVYSHPGLPSVFQAA